MSEPELIRGPEEIDCPICRKLATRQGAQDGCDIYLCAQNHLTRIKVGTQP